MFEHCHHVSSCKVCKFGSRVFGHGLTRLLGLKWKRITLEQVQPLLTDLDLRIVGGLVNRGFTEHDIDVLGDEDDVSTLVKRLKTKKINNLVHYCGSRSRKHSHWQALKTGFLVTFFGNRIYI